MAVESPSCKYWCVDVLLGGDAVSFGALADRHRSGSTTWWLQS